MRPRLELARLRLFLLHLGSTVQSVPTRSREPQGLSGSNAVPPERFELPYVPLEAGCLVHSSHGGVKQTYPSQESNLVPPPYQGGALTGELERAKRAVE